MRTSTMSSPTSSKSDRTESSPKSGAIRGTARARGLWLSISLSTIAMAPLNAMAGDLNDYPTSARADYVFACMKANGETQDVLQKCSCSIDVVASLIPYDKYVAAE